MITLPALIVFVSVYAAAVASPGPGIAALVARVVGKGLHGVAPFIAGYVVGDLIWLSLAASGLEVLAHRFAILFVAIKYCGALYLLYLALAMWRAGPAHATPPPPQATSAGRLFLGSLSLTLGNPKVIVFFLSIMPLAIDVSTLGLAAFIELGAICAVILSSVLFAYALAANRARRFLASPRAMRVANRGLAGVLAGAAVAVATR